MYDLILTLLLYLVLSLFVWFFFWPYKQYRIDLYRQRMFALRDDLFLEAHKGTIAFQDSAYIKTRQSLNGAIRFADEACFFDLALYILFLNRRNHRAAQFKREFSKSLQALETDEARQLIYRAHVMTHVYTLDHLVHTSVFAPMLIPLKYFAILMMRTFGWANRLRDRVAKSRYWSKFWARFDKDMNDMGSHQPG